MAFRAILFDLDGTLTDSGIGITRSVAYALEKAGYPVPEQSVLDRFVGPPMAVGLREITHVPEADVPRCQALFDERNRDVGWRENRVYEGVEDVLRELKAAGYYLAIASSKPEFLVLRVVEHFGIAKYFDRIVGTTPANLNAAKDQLLLAALPEGCEPSDAAMVGDRKYDMLAAKRIGAYAVGALYGYGDREELKASGADIIAEQPGSLLSILTGTAR